MLSLKLLFPTLTPTLRLHQASLTRKHLVLDTVPQPSAAELDMYSCALRALGAKEVAHGIQAESSIFINTILFCHAILIRIDRVLCTLFRVEST